MIFHFETFLYILCEYCNMNVYSTTIIGDLYEYDTGNFTVLKSDYGNFLYSGKGELEGFHGRVQPYHVDILEDEERIQEDIEISVYVTDEKVFVPTGDELNEDSSLHNTTIVIDGEIAVSFGQLISVNPNVIGKEFNNKHMIEVYTLQFSHQEKMAASPDYVEYDDLMDVFDMNTVEEVKVV